MMKNKFTKGICVILVACLFLGAGIILKLYAEKAASGDMLTDEERAELEKEEEKEPPVKEITFVNAPEGYWNDALFIGDSRTEGIRMYSGIEGATYFSSVGLSVYGIEKETVYYEDLGEVTLEQLLTEKKFGKIYIMLGINELGSNQDTTVFKYGEILKSIRKLQPETTIFIQANIHVGAEKSNYDAIFKNSTINELNGRLATYANNIDTVYIDANPLFDDANGDLNAEYTGDNVHLYANHYVDWKNWLETKAVGKDAPEGEDETKTDDGAKKDENKDDK